MSADFIYEIEEKLKSQLPGHEMQREMVEGRRITPQDAIDRKLNPRQSAVLLSLYPEKDHWNTVFILRNSYKGVHSNQISLPGGKKELTDNSLEETALRESHEEVGIRPDSVRILGQLSELYIPPSNFIVRPYVGVLQTKPNLIPDPIEVNKIITSPISRIFDADVIKKTELYLDRYDRKIKVSYFDIENQIVWGATAIILKEFRQMMVGD